MPERPTIYMTDERYSYAAELAESDEYDSVAEVVGEALDAHRLSNGTPNEDGGSDTNEEADATLIIEVSAA